MTEEDEAALGETLALLEPEAAEAFVVSPTRSGMFETGVQLSIAISLRRIADALERRG